jgi:antitoxin (DNA-binding transcriptional repressor) of toxin-antitoxin stability system
MNVLDTVKSGGEIVVAERGKPIARVVPFTTPGATDARMRDLARAGLVRLGEQSPPTAFFQTPGPRDPQGKDVHYLLANNNGGHTPAIAGWPAGSA